MINEENIRFTLIDPRKVIEQYIDIWKMGCNENNKYIEVFPKITIDISEYKCVKGKIYAKDDAELKDIFTSINVVDDYRSIEKDHIQGLVEKLDNIYNTMLKKRDETANSIFENIGEILKKLNKLKESDNIEDIVLKKNLVDYIATINKMNDGGTYIYSFATKFCSFLFPEAFPIFDSIASTLICKYLNNKEHKCSHGDMGNYGKYLNAYKSFIKIYELTNYSYKQIDSFLWLYGKIMSEYWKKIGVIKFESVYYKPPILKDH